MAEAKVKKTVAAPKAKSAKASAAPKVAAAKTQKEAPKPAAPKAPKAVAPKVEKDATKSVASAPKAVVATPKAAPASKANKGKVKSEKKVFSGKTVVIVQVASGAGRLKNQIKTLVGLGLGKLHRQVELEDTPAVRGMIRTVSHLIKIVKE